MTEQDRPMLTFNQVISAARREEWDKIDALLPRFCNDQKIWAWVWDRGVDNPDKNVRDLAVSLVELSEIELDPKKENTLKQKMDGDDNRFVQYRSAFALFTHGVRIPEVLTKIKEASRDEDETAQAAGQKYLKQLEDGKSLPN